MTSPHVDLGNSYQDTGQGFNTFAAGLLAQRQRQSQIALQEALNKSQTAHLDAETNTAIPAAANEANARTDYMGSQTRLDTAKATQDEYLNQPADAGDEALFMRYAGPMKPGFFAGKTKAQTDELIKAAAQAHSAGLRLSLTGDRNNNNEENSLRTAYMNESKPGRLGIDNYRETLNAFNLAKNTDNPVAGEGMLLSWLKQRTNRMNQTELNRVASLGGPDNIVHRFMSHVRGGVPMDNAMLKNFLDAATPGGAAHYNDYQALRHNYTSMAMRKGIDPSNIVTDDDYGQDIPQLEQSIGAVSGGPTTSNPGSRFLKSVRPGPVNPGGQ